MGFIDRTSIRTKFLILPFVMALVLSLGAGHLAKELNRQYKTITNFAKDDLSHSQELLRLFAEISLNHNRVLNLLDKNGTDLKVVGKINKLKTVMEEDQKAFFGLTKKHYLTQKNEKLIGKINEDLALYNQEAFNLFAKLTSGQVLEETEARHLKQMYSILIQNIDQLSSRVSRKTQNAIKKFQSDSYSQMIILFGVLFTAIFGSTILGLIFANYLSRPIRRLVETIKKNCGKW